ncbi:MAG: AlpA family transcriptional regulator [Rhodobacter sp.]|nr:AlpA family transcriptional regulator [Rhodobacter sp.]MCA3523570.1 AlpA family transcriptional regulator [Rhodobacter sp.]MCA3526419.1 AlpA family transcriptional regulator [Rhodobacter sp.]MCA3529629.1 AlpA family transcriptional regulator [Rhodobacter sp.]MCA3531511.1 AlpA family transcriptional regulator [Rhodobacter sp.]
MQDDRIHRLPEVMQRTKLGRSTIYSLVAAKQFPQPIKLGPRAVGWSTNEISNWLQKRADLREAA